MELQAYLNDPCGSLAIPWYKAQQMTGHEPVKVVHERDFRPQDWQGWTDECFFRLLFRPMRLLEPVQLADGFVLRTAVDEERLADFINLCYTDIRAEAEQLRQEARQPWSDLAWRIELLCGEEIAASGIAAADRQTGEGSLEWIQVSPRFRRKGLGRAVVTELLRRLYGTVDFVTVSGRADSPHEPQLLYRSCGFSGNDIWHVLRSAQKEKGKP